MSLFSYQASYGRFLPTVRVLAEFSIDALSLTLKRALFTGLVNEKFSQARIQRWKLEFQNILLVLLYVPLRDRKYYIASKWRMQHLLH